MNKEQLNQKLSDLEEEAANLRSLINEPEQRKPEAGDVWLDVDGSRYTIDVNGYALAEDGWRSGRPFALRNTCINERATYLGKHHEVYVNRAEFISLIRAALSHKDSLGGCILNPLQGCGLGVSGLEKSRRALRKLNIITD